MMDEINQVEISISDISDISLDKNHECDNLYPCSHYISIHVKPKIVSQRMFKTVFDIKTPIKSPEIVYYFNIANIELPDHLKKYVDVECFECDDFEFIYDLRHPLFSYDNLKHYDFTKKSLCFNTNDVITHTTFVN